MNNSDQEESLNNLVWGLETATRIMRDGNDETEVKMICGIGDKDIVLHFRKATPKDIEDSPSGFLVTGYNPFKEK